MPQICLGLDFSPKENLQLAKEFQGIATFVKLGPQNIFEEGPSIIQVYRDLGFKIFLDCKFHDIPHTISRVAAILQGVDIMTLHLAGGQELFDMVKNANPGIALAGVGKLTSISEKEWRELGFQENWPKERRKAMNNVDYWVMSGREFRAEKPQKACIVPGIRFDLSADSQDQKEVTSLHEALTWGEKHLIVCARLMKDPRTKAFLEEHLHAH